MPGAYLKIESAARQMSLFQNSRLRKPTPGYKPIEILGCE